MPLIVLASWLALLALPQDVPAGARPQASDVKTREIYVSVVDGRGEPITDLSASDFTVREDGVAREVLNARPATEKLTISLLVDDTQSATEAVQYIRDGLTRFVKALGGKADMALATFGDRTTPLVEYTSDPAALQKGIGRIFARSGAGSMLLDAIVDVSRGLERRQATRPTIVVVTTEGVEFSNLSHQQVLDALHRSGATLETLTIGPPKPDASQEIRERTIALAEGADTTGGRRDQVLALSGLPDRMEQLARELANQYVVTYGRPDTLIPPETVRVSVSRPGATVRATSRAPGR
jgi:VWFA-related protein